MDEFQRRRQTFVTSIGDGVAIFPSAPIVTRSNDTGYSYRQNSDLHYLSGFDEPESVLVLAPKHPEVKSALFVRPHDKDKETWDGRRAGIEGAKAQTGVDAAYPIAQFEERLGGFLDTADRLFYAFGNDSQFDKRIIARLRDYRRASQRSGKGPVSVIDPASILHELRLFKSAAEVAGMRRAVEVSGAGHIAAMRHARPGMREYEVEAIVEYVFTSSGAQSPAYSTIVTSGKNLPIIHYDTNRDPIPNGSLVLVDAGAEVDYYCGDITRTWPISGKFSAEQREVYEIVLAANLRAIELCRAGRKYNSEINDEAARVLVEGLIRLGLLEGTVEAHLEKQTHKRFTQHRIGHWLGLDTHDVGSYRAGAEWRPLEPGMIVTIEPGIYIPDEPDIPQRMRNISVRIEDDVLVTAGDPDVLSAAVPKAVHAVEQLMAEGRATGQALIA
ncbi:MAG: aminopeptidase P N-terminal domain-containing protein [Candidatus Eremiobacteraeota bacterium]|nr:aminopeptidase P N-terminal domain-containing protein [Candidatus Eremiobacteraeota bacterium]